MRKVFLTSLFMSLLTMSAYALEFDASDLKTQFYGQLHASGFYQSNDAAASASGVADANFAVKLHDYSRFGAKLIFGSFSGVVELQPNFDATAFFADSVFRRMYVKYNFSEDAALTVGKDWTPIGYSFDQYADGYNGLWGYGTIWEDRQPLVAYEISGFKIAAIYNQGAINVGDSDLSFASTGFYYSGDRVQKLPKFELSYVRENDMYDCKLYAGYTRYHTRITNDVTSDTSVVVIDSYILGFGTKVNISDAFISATVFFGENLATYGVLPYSNLMPIMNTSSSVQNVQSGGVAGAVGYSLNEMVEVVLGGGATFSSNNGFSASNSNTMYSIFFNVPLQVTKFLKVIPEISYFDNGRDFNESYVGASVFGGVYFLAEF